MLFYETQTIKLHDTTPPAVLLAGGAAGRKRHKRTYFPAAAEIKFLLDFFYGVLENRMPPLELAAARPTGALKGGGSPKKSRVQGGALPLPAQGRM